MRRQVESCHENEKNVENFGHHGSEDNLLNFISPTELHNGNLSDNYVNYALPEGLTRQVDQRSNAIRRYQISMSDTVSHSRYVVPMDHTSLSPDQIFSRHRSERRSDPN